MFICLCLFGQQRGKKLNTYYILSNMSPKNYLASYKLRSIFQVLYRYRSSSYSSNKSSYGHYSDVPVAKMRYDHLNPMHKGLQLIAGANIGASTKPDDPITVEDDKKNDRPPIPPPSTTFIFSNWIRWIFGSILFIIFPFWREKWTKVQRIEGEMEKVGEEVEIVANVVEKVATEMEKVSAELADKLPENCKLKEATLLVGHASNVVAKDAEITIHFIHKVDEVEQDLEDLGTMVEPILNKIVERKSGGK